MQRPVELGKQQSMGLPEEALNFTLLSNRSIYKEKCLHTHHI